MKKKLGNYAHVAIVGEGNMKVVCTFDMTGDGEIENLAVHDGDVNVTPYLDFSQIEELEIECYDSYCKQAKENNDDLLINQFLAGAI